MNEFLFLYEDHTTKSPSTKRARVPCGGISFLYELSYSMRSVPIII